MKDWLHSASSPTVIIASIVAAVLGAVLGSMAPVAMQQLEFVGQWYVGALVLTAIPMVILAILLGVTQLGEGGKTGRSLMRTGGYILLSTVVASTLAGVVALVAAPGTHIVRIPAAIPQQATEIVDFSFSDALAQLIGLDPLAALGSGNFLGLVLLSILMGAMLVGRKNVGSILTLLPPLYDSLIQAVSLLVVLSPVAIFTLVGGAVAGADKTGIFGGQLMMFSVVVLATLVVWALVVLPAALRLSGYATPYRLVGRTLPALLTAFASGSRAAALPVAIQNVSERAEIDRRATAFMVPIGSMLNNAGTAIFMTVATVFAINLFSISVSVGQVLAMSGTILFVSLAAASLPGPTWLYSLGVVFFIGGLPVEVYAVLGLLVGVDWLFSRVRVAVDVWGDAVGAALLNGSFDFKTVRNQVTPPGTRSRPQERVERRQFERRTDSRDSRDSRGRDRSERERPDDRTGRGRDDRGQRRRFTRDERPDSGSRGRGSREPDSRRGGTRTDGSSDRAKPRPTPDTKEPIPAAPPLLAVRRETDTEPPRNVSEALPVTLREDDSPEIRPSYYRRDRFESSSRPAPQPRERTEPEPVVEYTQETQEDNRPNEPVEPMNTPPTPTYTSRPASESAASEPDRHNFEPEPTSEPSEPAPMTYGRTVHRRGASKPEGESEGQRLKSDVESETTEPTGSYSTEGIEFGRSPKKKPSA